LKWSADNTVCRFVIRQGFVRAIFSTALLGGSRNFCTFHFQRRLFSFENVKPLRKRRGSGFGPIIGVECYGGGLWHVEEATFDIKINFINTVSCKPDFS
jgi:hypothetical protein